MVLRPILCVSILAALLAGTATAAELGTGSLPRKWLEPYLPEQLPELKFPSYATDLDKARGQALAGRYKLALLTIKNAKLAGPQAAWVKGYALAATGRRDEALAVLADPAVAADPAVGLLTAQIRAAGAEFGQAIDILQKLVAQQPEAIGPRFHLGLYLEQTGRIPQAREQYDKLHEQWWDRWRGQGTRLFEDAESLTLLGRSFDRWARLNGKYADGPQLPKLILQAFVQAYDVVDRSYWPAHLAAAEYYLSHENDVDAGKELEAALKLNPNDAHTLALAGQLALGRFDFDTVDSALASIRQNDPHNLEAALLEARSLLHQRVPRDGLVAINQVLARHPNLVEALAIRGAAEALLLREEELQRTLARIEELEPGNATAYFELAEHLSAMRQYPRAEAAYAKAIERAPWMSEARNGLGLLLTQSGDEAGARKVLEAAVQYDPFNYRTINYLRLLDRLEKMDRQESAHFVLVYDRRNDPVIDRYVLPYLESIYAEVCAAFDHEPTVKTIIEIFPTHEQFSARVTGAPWIGTVGASTGSVIALVTAAPVEGNALGTYNWAQVLRHEFTHTVTLSATENRIAHWMTEGLAVLQEQTPVRWEWVPMLYDAVKNRTLFDMESLTWAFVRPRKPSDRQLAYAQSAWVCQFIGEKWGRESVLKMMAAFKAGQTQDQAFTGVLGVPVGEFEKQFFAWTETQIAAWGYDAATTRKVEPLIARGQTLLDTRQYDQALHPADQLPRRRLAFLYLDAKNWDKARAMLRDLHQMTVKDNRFAKRIARLCLDTGDLAGARKYAMEAVYVAPYDIPAHELLVEVATKSGDDKLLAQEKEVVAMLTKFKEEQRRATLMPGAPEAPKP
jgi:Flp pilus assembly protein TadD